MKMKLYRYASPSGDALILDTGGRPPEARERQLLCCRSLTLPVDRLLLGPLTAGPPLRVLVLDADGCPAALTAREAEAFAVFLRDEGYAEAGPLYVTDGTTAYSVGPGRHGWTRAQKIGEERQRELLGI